MDSVHLQLYVTAICLSYGTLGFLTAAKLRIVKYKPFIKLDYWPTYSLDETTEVLERETKKAQGNDSVEGIAYSRDTAVIMTGIFVEANEVFYQNFSFFYFSQKKTFLD